MPIESWPAHTAQLGPLTIRRALPVRQRRMVGPWCFLDRYGPVTFQAGKPMDVAPHPHIGLQTVSWILDGEVLHRDSLGFESLIVAGELNLMTSGRAISHSEETPPHASGALNGVQLWVALPDKVRNTDPAFNHYRSLPVIESQGGRATVFMGTLAGIHSPALAFSPMVGAQLSVDGGGELWTDLHPRFEHALFVLDGAASLEGEDLAPDILYYLAPGRAELALTSRGGARLLLIGGAPFGERILMWWNFVARTHEEIDRARREWQSGTAFGEVKGYAGPRLEAPALVGRAAPPTPAS
jgi:quercetin 2,3-dioxygenase